MMCAMLARAFGPTTLSYVPTWTQPVKMMGTGGRGEIRTHETLSRLPVFKTGALNHSATLPQSGLALERAVAQSYQEKLQQSRSAKP
jgi:hypothetical protein